MNVTGYVDALLAEATVNELTIIAKPTLDHYDGKFPYDMIRPLYIISDTFRVKPSVLSFMLHLAKLNTSSLKVSNSVVKQFKTINPKRDQWVTLKIDIKNPKCYQGNRYYGIKVNAIDKYDVQETSTSGYLPDEFDDPDDAIAHYKDLDYNCYTHRFHIVKSV